MKEKVMVSIKRMKLADLKPADYNPRRISDEAFAGLGNSIERFGMLSYIVWNKRSGNIVGGHQRFKHLLAQGENETDVVVVDLDDNEEVALNITLNNKEVRGDFTKDVIEQLRFSEAQLGSAFKQLGLLDLYEYLHGRGYDKKPKDKKSKDKMPTNAGANTEEGEVNIDPEKSAGKSQVVITCPSCKSQWNLKNNVVVFNAITNMGKPIGVQSNADQKVEN